jgi:DNA mismatch repair ATPase MutS
VTQFGCESGFAYGFLVAGLISKFNENAVLWRAAVSAASQLDALASLAAAASSSHIPVCRPKFIRSGDQPAPSPSTASRAV